MRTTINIDDELLAQAVEFTGITERNALVREALETLVRLEAGKRLILLGGSDPYADAAPRQRNAQFWDKWKDQDKHQGGESA